jgi:glutamate/tyrosine decarboxylase-like PLP-dependent enzyme
VEKQVIDWCASMFGLPAGSSGILVSGGSMANLIGLTVARNNAAGTDIRTDGLIESGKEFRIYASSEVHSSATKAVELLGLGRKNIVLIRTRKDFTVDVTHLTEALRSDIQHGYTPLCIIGCAGTVNTGAVDPLDALADVAKEHGVWFHVDGAFGALAALSPKSRSLVRGIERADSVAFDLHKWMHMPIEVGCTLVSDRSAHHKAFTLTPDYLEHTTRGIAGTAMWFSDYGIQLSRGFRALKVWMSIKEHGIAKYGRLVQQNIDQAHYLESLIASSDSLELLAPVQLNIVCFRFTGAITDREQLNTVNGELLTRLQESGVAAPSHTTINGDFAIRVCITNHRTTYEDLELLVEEVIALGRSLNHERTAGGRT